VFVDDDLQKRDITLRFFQEIPILAEEICISEEVIREINRASEPRKSQLKGLIREVNPILLDVNQEAMELSERYVGEGIIPERYKSDSLHIAIAVCNNIDVIVSWNFSHIVKLKTRIMVNGINKLLGYHEIEICSPEEVIEL